MEIKKRVLHNLTKCYSMEKIRYNDKDYMLVAAEKQDACLMFDMDGNYVEQVWDGPGGTMSMVEVPGSNGMFLATHKFYSPNDSKDAKIICAKKNGAGGWDINTLVHLPHVHRFDIIERNGIHYLIAATVCSDCRFKDDWAYPGKVYACRLPEDLDKYSDESPLKMEIVKDGLIQNHGYSTAVIDGVKCAIIGSREGIFQLTPPGSQNDSWVVEQLTSEPASDMTLIDLDGDGELEIFCISYFHGENIEVYKKKDGFYKKVWKCDTKYPFAHSIWSGNIKGKPTIIMGHRNGSKDLLYFSVKNTETLELTADYIDRNVGSANVYIYEKDSKRYILSTNREIDEIALYEIS